MHSNREHILLANALSYPRRDVPQQFEDSSYDVLVGAWVQKSTGQIVADLPEQSRVPQTKKNDVETGEDQKGH